MSNRIKQLEKEIALTRELIELRRKLNTTEQVVNVKEAITQYNGGIVPAGTGGLVTTGTCTVKFGNTDIRKLMDINVGQVDMTTLKSADTTYSKLKYGEDTKVKSQWTESSEEMWKGIKTPNYQEGRGPCECEYFTE